MSRPRDWTAGLRPPHRTAGLLLALVALSACGYRPAASLGAESGRSARVPAFISTAADPELDVYAAAHLVSRLEASGVPSGTTGGDVLVQGYLVEAGESLSALRADGSLVGLRVAVRAVVQPDRGAPCETATAEGTAPLHVPYATSSEAERLVALRDATGRAIDALVLDVLLCLDGLDAPYSPD